jgi:hypothetical protein
MEVMTRTRRSSEDERRAARAGTADGPERGGTPVCVELGMKRARDEVVLEAGTWSRR